MNISETYIKILEEELVLALGCTEPIAIALASAKCREVLAKAPDQIIVNASGNIIKNVKGVIIPGTSDLKGVELATILGAIVGDSSKHLQVLQGITNAQINEAIALKEKGLCSVEHKKTEAKLYIEVVMHQGQESASVEVMHSHTNITRISKNRQLLLYNPCSEDNFNSSLTDRSTLSVAGIYDFASSVDLQRIKPLLSQQLKSNLAITKEGLENNYGLNVGSTLLKTGGGLLKETIRAYGAAGSDARMSGCDMPVVINSGSGNQGLTISSPLYAYAQANNISEERLYRGLLIGNLIPIHMKTKIGRLSALCGGVTAGIGVGTGITYLENGSLKQVENTIKNAISNLAGVFCDGAKPSCALKIASGIDAAYLSHQLSMDGAVVKDSTGIIDESIEQTISNLASIASLAMGQTDDMIINIMTTEH